MTISDRELANLDGPIACREYTLPRNEESTRAKGWMDSPKHQDWSFIINVAPGLKSGSTPYQEIDLTLG